MIIDSHCHAWRYWPYSPSVPDPQHRGSAAQLRHEMIQHGVDAALIVCAEIAGQTENNAYIAEIVAQSPEQFYQIAELDSHWKSTYHQPGAADRLEMMCNRWQLTGLTHYLSDSDDGAWLYSQEGLAMLEVAAAKCPIFSLHCKPHQMPAVQLSASSTPGVTFLIHHLGHPQAGNTEDLKQAQALAATENIHLKISGFYYGTRGATWDFPMMDMQPAFKELYQVFGAGRLHWGSDFPVCQKKGITYIQSLEILRTHCRFVTASDMDKIMGNSLHDLLTI